MALVSYKRFVREDAPVLINCPACHASGVTAVPRLYEEPVLLLHFIPLFTMRSAFLECGACQQSLVIGTRDLTSLASLSPEERSHLVRPYVSGVGRFFVVSALVLFWFPFLAPILSLAGLWMTRRHPTWRRIAIVSVVLSFAVAAAVAVLLVSTANE